MRLFLGPRAGSALLASHDRPLVVRPFGTGNKVRDVRHAPLIRLVGLAAVLAALGTVACRTQERNSLHEGRKPNRLIHEKSPYLLQHAYNPVDWRPWGEDAFAAARREDK